MPTINFCNDAVEGVCQVELTENEGEIYLFSKSEIVDDRIHIILQGTIYVEDAKGITEKLVALIEAGQTRLLIDLSQVEYIDSSGLGMLIRIQKIAVRNGGNVVLKGVQGLVRELFEMTRLTALFNIQ